MPGVARDEALLEIDGERDDRTVDEEEPLDGADDGGQEEDLDEKMRGSLSGRGHTSRNAEPPPTCLAVQIKGPVAGRLRGRFFGLREAVVVVFTKFLTRNIHVWPTGSYGL